MSFIERQNEWVMNIMIALIVESFVVINLIFKLTDMKTK